MVFVSPTGHSVDGHCLIQSLITFLMAGCEFKFPFNNFVTNGKFSLMDLKSILTVSVGDSLFAKLIQMLTRNSSSKCLSCTPQDLISAMILDISICVWPDGDSLCFQSISSLQSILLHVVCSNAQLIRSLFRNTFFHSVSYNSLLRI